MRFVRSRSAFGASAVALLLALAFALVQTVRADDAGSDEFTDTVLNTAVWTFVNPRNDSALSMTGTQLRISVPGGSNHFTWTGINTAPRVMQASANTDFEIDVKFDSAVTQPYQSQGLRIEQNLQNSLTIQFHSTGTSTELTYGHVVNGVAVDAVAVPVPITAPLYMRLLRMGTQWTIFTSPDGENWQTAATTQRALTVTAVGVFAGNYSPGRAPAHTGLVDYFRKRTIVPAQPPLITTHPSPVTVTAPAAASFAVAATGDAPLSYQWRRDGVVIAGATAANFTLEPTTLPDDGAEFDVVVSNPHGTATSTAARLTVTTVPVNNPPVAADDTFAISGQTALTVGAPGVLANDTDPQGTTLTALQASAPVNGTVTLSGSGGFTYMPNEGFGGTDSFTYQASDGELTSNIATVTLQVSAASDTIVYGANAYNRNEIFEINLTRGWSRKIGDLLFGSQAIEQDRETGRVYYYEWEDAANEFAYFDPATGANVLVRHYAPAPGVYPKRMAFSPQGTLYMMDNQDRLFTIDKLTGELTSLGQVSGLPLGSLGATGDMAFAPDGTLYVATYRSLFSVSVDTLTATLLFDEMLTGSGVLVWSGLAYCGDQLFASSIDQSIGSSNLYRIDPGSGSTTLLFGNPEILNDLTSCPISVMGGPPEVNDLSVNTLQGIPVAITLNGSDPDQDPLTFSVISPPSHGTLTGTAPGLTYTPQPGFLGVDTFTYRASDGVLQSNVATVTITVAAVPVPPTIASHPQPVTVTAPAPAAFSVAATGDAPLSYQWRRNGVPIAGATSGTYTLDPTGASDDGTQFDVVVSNVHGSITSNSASLTVHTPPPNALPVAEDDSYAADASGQITTAAFNGVLANDFDGDGHPLTAVLVDGVSNGTLELNADGSFSYVHNGIGALSHTLQPGSNSLVEYGVATAIDGDTLVVGANSKEGGKKLSGAAYVFVREGLAWTLQAKLRPKDPVAVQFFGWAVDISGDTIVVGAPGDDDAGQYSGSAYVFVRSGTTWTQQAKLAHADARARDEFGVSVAIDGDTIVAGAHNHDDGAADSGAAFVFVRQGSGWTQQAELHAPAPTASAAFGLSVDIDAESVVVGAVYDDTAGLDAGASYVFVRGGSTWTLQATLTASDATPLDTFGFSASLQDDTVIIGANSFGEAGGSGAAYVFQREGSTWTERQKLSAADATGGGFGFGVSVALEDDTILVGAHGSDAFGTNAGAAYVFRLQGTDWVRQDTLHSHTPSAGAEFGVAVALDGGYAVIGANSDKFELVPDQAAGSADVFQIAGPIDSFTYVANDGIGNSLAATVTITIR